MKVVGKPGKMIEIVIKISKSNIEVFKNQEIMA